MTYLRRRRPAPSPRHPRVAQRRRTGIGALLATIAAFAIKFKFLLFFGAKLFGLSWTFLLSLWIYVVIFGWKLAVVVMLLLLAHELGHYFAFRAYGLPARLPAFIPLLGAFTAGAPPDGPRARRLYRARRPARRAGPGGGLLCHRRQRRRIAFGMRVPIFRPS